MIMSETQFNPTVGLDKTTGADCSKRCGDPILQLPYMVDEFLKEMNQIQKQSKSSLGYE